MTFAWMPVLRLILVLLLAGGVAFFSVALAMALVLLRPPRMSAGKAMALLHRNDPGDLGLSYVQQNFTVRDARTNDAIRVAAWWIEHSTISDRTVVIVHGYADAKVGGIAWAPMFASMGFNILAIDLRAHGASQGSFCTAGFVEQNDVSQVIDQLVAEFPTRARRVFLFGVSLGAAVVAAVGARRDDLAGVILECPYLDFPSAFMSQARRLAAPGLQFQRLALWLTQRIANFKFDQVRPVDLIPRIAAPLLVIQSCDDPFVPPDHIARIQDAVLAGKSVLRRVWQLPDCHHVVGLRHATEEYIQRLRDFCDEATSMNEQKSPGAIPANIASARPLQSDGRLHGVVVACRREDGRWLCIRRSATVPAPLKVCFPGGAIEQGESQSDAAIREMQEELGVAVEPIACVWHFIAPDRNLTLWGWTARLLSEAIQPDAGEIAEVLWLTSEEVTNHSDAMPTNKDFVENLRQNATQPREQARHVGK